MEFYTDQGFYIVCEGALYPVFIESNSPITYFVFNQSLSKISFKVTSYSSETGFCKITIPKSLMKGPWSYTFEGDFLNVEVFEDENATQSFIRLTYEHTGEFTVIIKASWVISEFSSTTAVLVLSPFITTTLWKIIRERKQTASSHL